MSLDKKKIAAASWQRASQSLAKQDWDFAIEMLAQCVTLVPDNLMYRQTLRGTEQKKYNNNKTGARFAGTKLMGVRSKITLAKRGKNWEQVDLEAERGLQVNPWDAGLNADVGESCRERGFDDVAVFAYTLAIQSEPENKDHRRKLAEILEERGEYDGARAQWQQIAKLDPNDHEARRKENSLMTMKVIDRNNMETATSTRDMRPQQPPSNAYDAYRPGAAGSQAEMAAPGEDPETDLKHAIRKAPENKDLYLKLADLYRKADRLEEAMAQIQKALELSGGDQNIREQLEDVELIRMRKAVDAAAEKSRAVPEDEALKAKATVLRTELYKRDVQVKQARSDRYPKNLALKYELAQLYMKFKKWETAIPLLQAATADNRQEVDARILLGECFLNDNKKPLATRQFESAVKLVNPQDQQDQFLKCHYVLGRLAEDKGDTDTATNHYSEVLSLDYGYRDARTRLERLQGA